MSVCTKIHIHSNRCTYLPCSVHQDDQEVVMHQHQEHTCFFLFFLVLLGVELMASPLLGRRSTSLATLPALFCVSFCLFVCFVFVLC
jgi:hypothetical protein